MRTIGIMLSAALTAALLGSGAALADAGHGKKSYGFGEPGKAAEATRTVEVSADDQDGNMRHQMDLKSVRQGETIKFVVTNKGQGPHEFSVGDTASQRAHARLMAKNPDMKHEGDPSVVTVEPGETKELVWKFSKPVQGDIVFACQIPGHYEAGMFHKAKFEKAKANA